MERISPAPGNLKYKLWAGGSDSFIVKRQTIRGNVGKHEVVPKISSIKKSRIAAFFIYQIFILSLSGLYILSPGCILNALYHASILVRGPLQRYMLGECGSTIINCAAYSGKIFER